MILSIIGIIFWLAIGIGCVLCLAAIEVGVLIVNIIISIIEMCLCSGTASAHRKKTVVVSGLVKTRQIKSRPAKLSNRERRAIKKDISREIRKARDDMEYDMLMMMEVCADD